MTFNADEFFEDDLSELSSAEDFLDFFQIDYVTEIVQINRLHIMQRFHDYLSHQESDPQTVDEKASLYHDLLTKAYQDFVDSDALTEKVFKVFKMQEPQSTFVSIDALMK